MQFLKDIFYLFFPEICVCCENQLIKNEKLICLSCTHNLPFTNFCNEENNLVEKTFYGRVPIEAATAYLYYRKKGSTQRIIHHLKYRRQQKIGTLFGAWIGQEIKKSERFSSIDCIVPVPLYPKKQKQRGYNQLDFFGKSLSKELNIPFNQSLLIKKSNTKTQTLKQRIERFKNTNEEFDIVNSKSFGHKHILLIDDVITTGATIEACTIQLKKIKNIKISIATIGYTEN